MVDDEDDENDDEGVFALLVVPVVVLVAVWPTLAIAQCLAHTNRPGRWVQTTWCLPARYHIRVVDAGPWSWSRALFPTRTRRGTGNVRMDFRWGLTFFMRTGNAVF